MVSVTGLVGPTPAVVVIVKVTLGAPLRHGLGEVEGLGVLLLHVEQDRPGLATLANRASRD